MCNSSSSSSSSSIIIISSSSSSSTRCLVWWLWLLYKECWHTPIFASCEALCANLRRNGMLKAEYYDIVYYTVWIKRMYNTDMVTFKQSKLSEPELLIKLLIL